jgi:predicted acetyltransferase
MQLVRPTLDHLSAYTAALQRGWSADNVRGAAAAAEELTLIEADSAAFLALMDDPEARGPAVTLPDGSVVARLPSLRRWMWHDDDFVGSIGLRWQAGTPALPPHCLGHIGYAVVPWAQRQGHASAALQQLLPLARSLGLPHVEITTDSDNRASQRVIEKAGGVLHEAFVKPAAFGSKPGLRYRITLDPSP